MLKALYAMLITLCVQASWERFVHPKHIVFLADLLVFCSAKCRLGVAGFLRMQEAMPF